MLTRWDPFSELDRLTSRFFGFGDRGERVLVPAIDVFESDDAIEVRAELPGVSPEDITIEVSDGMLTLSGERKLEHEEKREGYRQIERSYGRFSRSFSLPSNVDVEHSEAEMQNGVLQLTLPKREKKKAGHRIRIKGAEGGEKRGDGQKKQIEAEASARG